MADFTPSTIPYRVRKVFTDANWVTFDFGGIKGARTLDIVFEDTSGNAVLGYVAPGFLLVGAPSSTDAKCAAFSWVADKGSFLEYLSVALANNHAVSVIIT